MRIFSREQLLPLEEDATVLACAAQNIAEGHRDAPYPLAFVAYEGDRMVGALDGRVLFNWLTVERVWVAESQRRCGTGTALLQEAERRARECGCIGSTLSTYDFQARPFFEKRGYSVFGVLENNPIGHERFFMRKPLA